MFTLFATLALQSEPLRNIEIVSAMAIGEELTFSLVLAEANMMTH